MPIVIVEEEVVVFVVFVLSSYRVQVYLVVKFHLAGNLYQLAFECYFRIVVSFG